MAKVVPVLDRLFREASDRAQDWNRLRLRIGVREVGPGRRSIIYDKGLKNRFVSAPVPGLTVKETDQTAVGHLFVRRTMNLASDQVDELANGATGPHEGLVSWIVETITASNALLHSQLCLDEKVDLPCWSISRLPIHVALARRWLNDHHALDMLLPEAEFLQVRDDKDLSTALRAALRGGKVLLVAVPGSGRAGWLMKHGAGAAVVEVGAPLALHWEPMPDLGVCLILTEQFGLDRPERIPGVRIALGHRS